MKEEFADLRKYVPGLAKFPTLLSVVERACGITEIRRLFRDSARDENPFLGVAQRVGMAMRFDGESIPKEGPVVVVANHAYGGADALALSAQCIEVRKDVKILANAELMGLEGVGQWFLPVSLLQKGSAAQENTASLRAMLKHVRDGGCLVVFPAGRIAVWQDGEMKDPPWNDHVVALMQRMKAEVVPVWFFGGISPWGRVISQFSVFIRRALIPRGLIEMQGREIVARVGTAFSSEKLRAQKENGSKWLRKSLERLRDSGN